MRPITLRSTSVRYANPKRTRLITISDLISAIHHGSPFVAARDEEPAHTLDDLDVEVEVGGVLLGDARDALDELAVDARAELDRGAVRAERDEVAARDPAPVGVAPPRARPRARGAGTGARGRARPGARRRAAGSAGAGACPTKWSARRVGPAARRRLRRGLGRDVRRARGQRRALAERRRGRGRRRSGRRAPRTRPPRAARAPTSKRCGELREPGELVGHGRRHGAAQALHAALEVHRGALALERRGRRAARGRPSRSASDGNIVIATHALGPLGERAHARVGRRLVAGDDEEPDPLGLDLVLVRRRGPRLGDAARVRRRAGGGTRRSRASPRSRARARPRRGARRRRRPGPDQISTARSAVAQALAERASGVDELRSASAALARRRGTCAARRRS